MCEAEEFDWQCPSCLFNVLPYHDAVTDASVDEDSSDISDLDLSQHDLPFISDVVSVSSSGVRLIHHNVQGLLSKMPEITQWFHICGSSPTTLCCSETWLRSNDPVGFLVMIFTVHQTTFGLMVLAELLDSRIPVFL